MAESKFRSEREKATQEELFQLGSRGFGRRTQHLGLEKATEDRLRSVLWMQESCTTYTVIPRTYFKKGSARCPPSTVWKRVWTLPKRAKLGGCLRMQGVGGIRQHPWVYSGAIST